MILRVILKQKLILSVFLVISLNSCASREIQIPTAVPSMGNQRMPFLAALIVPDTLRSLKTEHDVPCGGGSVSIPIGTVVEEGLGQVLLQLAEDFVVVKDRGSAIGQYDLLVEPSTPSVKVTGGTYLECSVSVRAQSKLAVYDRQGMTLLSKQIESKYIGFTADGRIKWWTGSSSVKRMFDRSVRETFADLFVEMVSVLSGDRKIRQYAQSNIPPSMDEARQPRIAITSDVDEIPVTRMIQQANRYALVIGVERYRNKLPTAEFATRDALIFAQYLIQAMGYREENVKVLLNEKATLSDITKNVEEWLPNRGNADSEVFVYYSGHGAPHAKTKQAYLVPYDGNLSFLESTGYSLNALYDSLTRIKAKHIYVVLDSCFSGAGGRSVVAKGARPVGLSLENPILKTNNIAVISASSGSQISSTYLEQGHGLLTYFFLKGLNKHADANYDGGITVNEIFEYVKTNVPPIAKQNYNNEQEPQLITPAELKKAKLVSQ